MLIIDHLPPPRLLRILALRTLRNVLKEYKSMGRVIIAAFTTSGVLGLAGYRAREVSRAAHCVRLHFLFVKQSNDACILQKRALDSKGFFKAFLKSPQCVPFRPIGL